MSFSFIIRKIHIGIKNKNKQQAKLKILRLSLQGSGRVKMGWYTFGPLDF